MTPPERAPAPAERITVAIVGDLISTRPVAPMLATDAGFLAVVERLRAADVAVGNLEFAAADPDDPEAWVWSIPNDWSIASHPRAVRDLRELGFGAVGRANNHAMDRGPFGMRATSLLLDEAGIDHAGAGEDLARASAPSYHETARGRLGIVSVTTSPSPPDVAGALDAFAGLASRPGIHALAVEPVVTVPSAAHGVLKAVHDAVPDAMGGWMNADPNLRVFAARFEPGDHVSVRYEVDPQGRTRLLRSVRQAARHADVVLMTVHAHQADADPASPPAFLRELARDAIAAGADAVAISGPHVLAPVELVDGCPVFYGLGDFIWSDLGGPLPAYFWSETRAVLGADIDPAAMTEAELVTRLNDDGFADPWVFRGIQAEVVVGPTGVEGVRVYPVDLGQREPITRRGVPRIPEPTVAAEILDRLRSMSAPLGTSIAIGDGVGTVVAGPVPEG
jgi:poly-gamma-glutamate capsule biosynthesis protein CapA/YwtB (metallophosphatase superfamily)